MQPHFYVYGSDNDANGYLVHTAEGFLFEKKVIPPTGFRTSAVRYMTCIEAKRRCVIEFNAWMVEIGHVFNRGLPGQACGESCLECVKGNDLYGDSR